MIDYRENNTAKVEAYGLAEWLTEVQELVQKGYLFDFDTNESYPLVFGSMYTCIMVLPEEKADGFAAHYMDGYTAGKEWGLAQPREQVMVDVLKPEYLNTLNEINAADDNGPVITEMKPVDITTVSNDTYGTKEVKPRKAK